MIQHTTNCVYCAGTIDLALGAFRAISSSQARNPILSPLKHHYAKESNRREIAATAFCTRCGYPYLFIFFIHENRYMRAVQDVRRINKYPQSKDLSFEEVVRMLSVNGGQLLDLALEKLITVYPQPREQFSHPSVPSEIADRINAAEHNLAPEACVYDGTMVHCRKVLELTCRDLLGKPLRNLKKAIEELSQKNLITPALRDWADTIRVLGNRGAHDAASPSFQEAQEFLEFTKIFVEYVFILPCRVADIRRKLTVAAQE